MTCRYCRIVLFRKSLRARLWLGGLAVALFVATLLGVNGVLAQAGPSGLTRVGHDFLPFYVAGSLVREGRPHDAYDLAVVRAREQRVAAENGLPLGAGFGPFWNPPFYALPFAPLSALPYRAALLTWLAINLAALAGAVALLCGIVARAAAHAPPYSGEREGSALALATAPVPGTLGRGDWRTWGLVPLLVLASTPFLMALTHGQNTFCSLLLLSGAVVAWRGRRAVLTGLLLGLLSYKPQLAALVGVVALIDLGWRVGLGAIASGGLLLLASAMAMPGALETYLVAMPRMLRYMQVDQPYMWERHVTLRAFWRLLLQGRAAGEASAETNALTTLSAGVLTAGVLAAAVRCRLAGGGAARRDRLIAGAVVAMPLVMPFYFDYDLLLLAVPAVLYAAERVRPAGAGAGAALAARHRPAALDRLVVPAWCVLYVWLTVNPDVALRTRVNVAVPLLACVAGLTLARALRRGRETAQCVTNPPAPRVLAAAA